MEIGDALADKTPHNVLDTLERWWKLNSLHRNAAPLERRDRAVNGFRARRADTIAQWTHEGDYPLGTGRSVWGWNVARRRIFCIGSEEHATGEKKVVYAARERCWERPYRPNMPSQPLEGALETNVDTMWIARDLGYRSGRRTGIPITDELHLARAAATMGGVQLNRATLGPPVAERTSTVVWRMLARIGDPILLWNAFPLHPHEAGKPLSNRGHTRAEREATWPLTLALIGMVHPNRIVAMGRDAADALAGGDVPACGVRHPSQGGRASSSRACATSTASSMPDPRATSAAERAVPVVHFEKRPLPTEFG